MERICGRTNRNWIGGVRGGASDHGIAKLWRSGAPSVNPAVVQRREEGLPGEVSPHIRKGDAGVSSETPAE